MPDTALSGAVAISAADLIEIKVTLTEIRERQTSAAKEAEHRHNNMRAALDGLMPRKEAEARFRDLDEDRKQGDTLVKEEVARLEVRISKVERFQNLLNAGFALGSATAAGALVFFGQRLGIKP